jgi:undecaprenyl-diphosphatase
MTWWQGIVLGVVQGFTEFLPISSSGHLVIAQALVGLRVPGIQVEVALHVATLIAVLVVYRRTLTALVVGALRGETRAWRYALLLAIATVPAGLVGFLLEDFFSRIFDSLFAVGADLIVTGFILWSTRKRVPTDVQDPSVGQAVGIGVAQACAILPGISRSGTTVATAMWLGVEPVKAAEFSFLLSIPAIVGAALLLLVKAQPQNGDIGGPALAISFITALICGIVAIRWLLALLQQRAFHRFAPYCWTIGAATVLWAVLSA